MSDPLADWTGEGIGEGVTTAPLYAREQPSTDAPSVVLWDQGEPLLLWARCGDWLLVSSLKRIWGIGWSSAAFIERT